MNVNHAIAGGFLTRAWGFPPVLSDCAEQHHAPTAPAHSDRLVGLTRTACLAAEFFRCPELTSCRPQCSPGTPSPALKSALALLPHRFDEQLFTTLETAALAG